MSKEDVLNKLAASAGHSGTLIFYKTLELAYDYYGMQYGIYDMYMLMTDQFENPYDLLESLDYRMDECPALIEIINEQIDFYRGRHEIKRRFK